MRARTLLVALALALPGCSGAVYGPALDRALTVCRQEGREAQRRGASFSDAVDVYERCKIREGAF